MEARRTVLILSTNFYLRAHGAGQNATFEHGMSAVLNPCSKSGYCVLIRAQGCFTTAYFTLAPYFFETSKPMPSNFSTNARIVA